MVNAKEADDRTLTESPRTLNNDLMVWFHLFVTRSSPRLDSRRNIGQIGAMAGSPSFLSQTETVL
jgi:hypothetical protein